MNQIIQELTPYIVSACSTLLILIVVWARTRTNFLMKKFDNVKKKATDSVDPNEYLVIYNGEVFPYNDCTLIKKSDYTYNEMQKVRKEIESNVKTTNE